MPASSRSSVTWWRQASVASSTALANPVPSFDSSLAMARKRLRAGSSSATPDSRKSRSACSTSARRAGAMVAPSASATACTAAYSSRFWPSSAEKSVIFSSAAS